MLFNDYGNVLFFVESYCNSMVYLFIVCVVDMKMRKILSHYSCNFIALFKIVILGSYIQN